MPTSFTFPDSLPMMLGNEQHMCGLKTTYLQGNQGGRFEFMLLFFVMVNEPLSQLRKVSLKALILKEFFFSDHFLY